MNQRIKELLLLMESENADEQEEATRHLGLLLEKNSSCPDSLSFYATVLPADILEATISDIERHELYAKIADLAVRLAEAGKVNPGMLWILGKGSGNRVIEALLICLCRYQANLDDTTMKQLLFSLGNFFSNGGWYSNDSKTAKLSDDYNLYESLKITADTRPLHISKLARDLMVKV